MTALLGAIPAVPLAGALILALGGARWSRRGIGVLGAGSVAMAAILALLAGIPLLREPGTVLQQHLGTWIQVGGLDVAFTLRLDALSLVMVLVVTGVGALIHIYSVAFMREDDAYGRFFATMNLFVGSMLVLVLAGDLLLLYLGWEGVGLCSYLLIGFWYRREAAGRAARKAFLVTRVGDTALAVALFLLFHAFGTLRIREIAERAPEAWAVGSTAAVAAAALLLLGAVGKSAQLPLQVWLPDAMEGPTPTSALIHAATMVTAGVYLIARLHVLFSLAPVVQHVVAGIGAATLLLAGCSALVQRDIKRVLAYSTISQIGYMFLALGAGAWTAAMFHLVTHAFFKALLFLVAGCVILAVHEEHDIFRMGGLRRRMPLVFWCAFIGGSALAGFPLVTAGFYSKGRILWDTLASPAGGPGLWLAGLAGVALTALYTYRWLFVVFLGTGPEDAAPSREALLLVPVVALGALSLVGGFMELPPYLGNVTLLSDLLRPVLPTAAHAPSVPVSELGAEVLAAGAFLLGLGLAYLLYVRRPELGRRLAGAPAAGFLRRWWGADWGFDALYRAVLIRPLLAVSRAIRGDPIDGPFLGLAALLRGGAVVLRTSQTGRVRWYAAGIVLGAVLALAAELWLP